MATQKRRVIYMTDEEWATAKRMAEVNKSPTVSNYLRSLVTATDEYRSETDARLGEIAKIPEREVIGAIREFNRRPFTPVPKGK